MLRIELFGRTRLIDGDTRLERAVRPKVLPLLAHLLLNAGRHVERRHVASDLWPDALDEDARTNLRRHLQYLRAYLPPGTEWFSAGGNVLSWNAQAPCSVDVFEFQRLVQEPATYADAVALYRGDLCEGMDETWLEEPRRKFGEQYMGALLALIYEARARRNFDRAIAYCRNMLASDPFREDALRQLLITRYEYGDRAGALQEYESFRARLRTELRVEPMAETAAVYESVLHDIPPAGAVHQTALPSTNAPGSEYPLVGRNVELAAMRAAWDAALQEKASSIFIVGEAGIGKTRLVRELAAICQAQGGWVAGGASLPDSKPFGPWMSILQSLRPVLFALSQDDVWLRALAPLFGEPLQLPALDGARERSRLFEAVASALERMSRRRPLCVVLEDLHWADSATLDLARHLARRVSDARLIFAFTYRDDEPGIPHDLRLLRRSFKERGRAADIPLRRLNEGEVRELAGELDATHLFGLSGGNPLYVTELLRAGNDAASHGDFAETVRARIGSLDADARLLANVGSVCTAPFEVELLAEVTGWTESRIRQCADTLIDRHILAQTTFLARPSLEFAHVLMRTALYDALATRERLYHHRRVAEVCERIYPESIGEIAGDLARHWNAAGENERAAELYVEAARRAFLLFAYEDARRPLESALRLTTQPTRRFDALLLLERIASLAGDRPSQRARLKDAGELAEQLDAARQCELLRRRIDLANTLSDHQVERETIDRLKALAREYGLDEWECSALEAESKSLRSQSRFSDEEQVFQELVRRSGGPAARFAGAYLAHADTLIYRGRVDEARALLEAVASVLDRDTDRTQWARTLMTQSRAALGAQDYAAMRRFAEQALAASVESGDREGEALALHNIANGLVYTFAVNEVRTNFARARSIYEDLQHQVGMASVAVDEALFNTELGLLKEAREGCALARRIAGGIDHSWILCVAHINAAYCERLSGDAGRSREHAQKALHLATNVQSTTLESAALGVLGCAELLRGNAESAIAHLRRAVELRRAGAPTPRLGDNLRALADALTMAGNFAEASTVASETLALYRKAPHLALQPADWLCTVARVYSQTGNDHDARDLMELAAEAVLQRGARIDDDVTRSAFYSLPFNREALAARSPSASR